MLGLAELLERDRLLGELKLEELELRPEEEWLMEGVDNSSKDTLSLCLLRALAVVSASSSPIFLTFGFTGTGGEPKTSGGSGVEEVVVSNVEGSDKRLDKLDDIKTYFIIFFKTIIKNKCFFYKQK